MGSSTRFQNAVTRASVEGLSATSAPMSAPKSRSALWPEFASVTTLPGSRNGLYSSLSVGERKDEYRLVRHATAGTTWWRSPVVKLNRESELPAKLESMRSTL